MRIKKLFKTESEFLDYAWSFLNFDEDKIWREEDLPKLQPFFDYSSHGRHKRLMNQKETEGFDHYEKCLTEYANALFEVRDAIESFNKEELQAFFLLEPASMECWGYGADGNEIDEDGNIMHDFCRENLQLSSALKEAMIFPLLFVGFIDSSSDRMGNIRICFSEFVTLKDFEE